MSDDGKRCGTWDFTEDAQEILDLSREPYLLVTGQEGSRIARIRFGWISTLHGVEWFRERVNRGLDELAREIEAGQ